MISARLITLCAALTLLAACGRQAPAPVPRPTAYPRVAAYDSVYSAVDSIALHFEANSAAKITRKSQLWFDIAYPAYDATVYVTVVSAPADSLREITANRLQRFERNISNPDGLETLHVESPEFSSVLLHSAETRTTPLQFLAGDGRRWIVSGAVFFKNATPSTPTDSLRPMVQTIRRDLIHALSTLGNL